MVSPNDEKTLPSPIDEDSPAARELRELETTTPQPEREGKVTPLTPFTDISLIPERELEKAPEPIVDSPLDFTYEMKRQGLLPANWPEGVSLFQDADLALSNLPAQKQEMLFRELLQFLPERDRNSYIQGVQSASGGQVLPLTNEEWRLAHVRPDRAWYEKTLGTISSFTEKPVVAQVMDALEWPSDRMEQVLGSMLYPTWSKRWWWDAPDGYSVWEHATLYGDILATSLQHSDFAGTHIKEVEAAMLRGEEWNNDPFGRVEWENVAPQKRAALQEELVSEYGPPGIYQQYYNMWGDLMFKVALDPLWLVGGIGFMPKVLRGGAMVGKLAKSSKWKAFLDIVQHGAVGGGAAPFKPYQALKLAKAAKMPILGAPLRILRRAGLSGLAQAETEALVKAMAHVDRSARVSRQGKKVGFLAGLFKPSSEAEATRVIRNSHNLIQVAAHDSRIVPRDMATYIDAVRTGDISKLPAYMPPKAVNSQDAVELAEILNVQKVRGNQLKTVNKTILTPDEFDVGMEKALEKSPKAAKKYQTLYSRGHEIWEAEFMDEAGDLLSKAIGGAYNYSPGGVAERSLGWYRRVLTATLLDNPAFAVLNLMYNSTNAFIGHGIAALSDGMLPRAIRKTLTDLDMPVDAVARTVGDPALGRQLGLAEMAGQVGKGARPSRWSWIHPWASMASWIDRHMRLKTTQIGILRTFRHNWHNMATPMPRAVEAALPPDAVGHLRSLADSAAEPGFLGRLDTAEELVEAGRPVMTTATLRDQWIDTFAKIGGKPVTGDARRLVAERFDQLGLTGILDEPFQSAANVDDLLRGIDRVRTSTMRDIDELRRTQHLEPISHLGVAPTEDLAKLTARRREIKTLIQEGTVTDPAEIARLEDEFADLDQGIRTARAAAGSTGENMYSIQIADDKLGKARVEMTDLWLQSHGFESGVARSKLDGYLKATREMYRGWNADQGRIFNASQAGERGIDAMWRGYEVNRLQELTDNMAALEKLIGEHNPSLLPSFRAIRDSRLNTMSAKDRAMRMALEAGEDVRYYDQAELMGPTRARIHQWIGQEVRTERDLMGLAPKTREFNMASANNMPAMGDAMTGELHWAKEFIDWAEPEMVRMFTSPSAGITPEAREATLLWLRQLRGDYKDLQYTALKVGRAMTDHLWYDYSRQFGGEQVSVWMLPYQFWPTRSMWLWGERIVSNPGGMASLAKAYDLMEEMTSELPSRFRGDFRLPVPLLGDKMAEMYGPATKMFFNPLNTMFPTMQWSQDFRFEDRQGTFAGRALDYWGTVGPGVSPFVPIAGSLVGLLERDYWMNRNYPRSVPFGLPGVPAQMAIVAFLNGADVDLPEWLSDDDMGSLMGGEGLPLAKLQRVLGVPEDKWDTYRIDRSLPGVFLEESKDMTSAESKVLLRDFLEAADTKSGPYWDKARQLASTEAGIRYLSGWAFMSVQLYPEGEQLMRALDPIYRMYAARGQLDTFYERWPEYQLRRVAMAGLEGEEAREEELHKTLFWYDLIEALEEREKDLAPVYTALDAVHEREEFYNTKIGRQYRSMYEEEQYQVIAKWQEEVNQIYARYEDVDKTPSVAHDPYTRALMSLRNDYYSIRFEDFLPKGKTVKMATKEEVLKADELYREAREGFVLDLPSARVSPGVKFTATMQHHLLGIETSAKVEALAREGKGADIAKAIEQGNADRLALMDIAKPTISRYDFETFLNRGKNPPSAVEESYKQAKGEMGRYMAMGELSIPTKAKKELRANYWDTHPLLERFYGNEPVGFTTSEAAAAYARLDEIRGEYYERDGVSRLNYIHSVLDEFNDILDRLGLPVITLDQIGVGDARRWDLSIPGIGLPETGRLEYSIEKRYSE